MEYLLSYLFIVLTWSISVGLLSIVRRLKPRAVIMLEGLWTSLIVGFLNQPDEKLAMDVRAIAHGVLAASLVSPIIAILYWTAGKGVDAVLSLASTPLILIAGLTLHSLARFIEGEN